MSLTLALDQGTKSPRAILFDPDGNIRPREGAVIAGDQQAALFGRTCFAPGMAKNTHGTGCFMLRNMGDQAAESRHRPLTTVAWHPQGRTTCALDGSPFIGGAMFSLICGATAARVARAVLESIACQVAGVLDATQADSRIRLSELRVDGGAPHDGLLMQFQADILGVPVVRCGVAETTALGAAYLAGLAAGFWKSPGEGSSHWHAGRRLRSAPRTGSSPSEERWRRWRRTWTPHPR
jgi:glycerol kinase